MDEEAEGETERRLAGMKNGFSSAELRGTFQNYLFVLPALVIFAVTALLLAAVWWDAPHRTRARQVTRGALVVVLLLVVDKSRTGLSASSRTGGRG